MANIHPTAIVEDGAVIGKSTIIGPYCIISKNVVVGENNHFHSHVVIDGHTTIADDNQFFPFACIGTKPQDLKYKNEPTRVNIGSNNTIREYVTINASNGLDEDTNVGSNNLIMSYVHVAHNCQIGDNIIISSSTTLAGHVHILDHAIVSGMCAANQFVKIGRYAFVGGASQIKKDIPPFTRGQGSDYHLGGLNLVGMQRRGVSSEDLSALKEIFKIFYRSALNVSQAIEQSETIENLTTLQREFIDFAKNSERGIVLNTAKGC
ncbi:MAG: acyl-[acyl-carrier-protein]--UDP-N-acetylglucosamine O-acyltransferase [Candidatus Cloacimonetes bacterium 4572_65]|nr:MAG: acyl-[acyl-carrier-protein]--UDP-N-acetylglucosamine O-acyltransferase [Candidatus Cloacimonetes bacterium 4572_65]